jgi:hypothetical protein
MNNPKSLSKAGVSTAIVTGLLVEAEDIELQDIVQKAAKDLSVPFALVTLILEHIQFYRAHTGLPPNSPRTNPRDVSFCQFVVRDGVPFEVLNAEMDPRVPKELRSSGIKSYFGVPVRVMDSVVGSLCVVETRVRQFSSEEKQILLSLAEKVSHRLNMLNTQRSNPFLQLYHDAGPPGIAELRDSLLPIHGCAQELNLVNNSLSNLSVLMGTLMNEENTSLEIQSGIARLKEVVVQLEDISNDIEASLGDALDLSVALESLLQKDVLSSVSDVLSAAQDLSRSRCRTIGSAPLPDLLEDPILATPKFIAVGLMANGMLRVAERMAELDQIGGLGITVDQEANRFLITLSGAGLGHSDYNQISTDLRPHVGAEQTVNMRVFHDGLAFGFIVFNMQHDTDLSASYLN